MGTRASKQHEIDWPTVGYALFEIASDPDGYRKKCEEIAARIKDAEAAEKKAREARDEQARVAREWTESLEKREAAVDRREEKMRQDEAALADKRERFTIASQEADARRTMLDGREAALRTREAAVELAENELAPLTVSLNEKEARLNEREKTLDSREIAVAQRENRLRAKAAELANELR